MYGSWKHMHYSGYRKPKFSGILLFLVVIVLFTGGFKWLIFPALFLLPMLFWGKHMWGGCDTRSDQEKSKNDEKAKRDDSPFYNDVEII